MIVNRTQPNRTQSGSISAPVMGMDTVSPGVAIPAGYSIYSYNLIGGEYGLRSRLGWREYATGLDEQVRTLLPFIGSAKSGNNNRLYATTTSGIWDVTGGGWSLGDLNVAVTPIVGGGVLTAGTWYFAVTAFINGVETGISIEDSAVFVGPNDSAVVIWDAVAGATSYRIYRGTAPGVYTVYDSSPVAAFSCGTNAGTAGSPPNSPTKVVTFTPTTDSGWGISTGFVNSAGNHYLCYCDEEYGYYTCDESGTWTAGGLPANPVTNVDPADLAFVMAWKNRLWFVEKDTASGWYLDIGAVTGPAVKFNFGARFKAGGDLRGLWSWTHEGGVGMDDDLVAVSGGGDVVIYRGTDPSDILTFGLQGVWYAGAVPSGRRLCTDFGGELLMMSSTGIQSLAKLSAGGGNFSGQYETAKISNLFASLQQSTVNLRGWSMYLHPQDSALIVVVPSGTGQASQQLVMSTVTKGWHQYRDMPMGVCAAAWNGTLYFGTEDGRICTNEGNVDGVLLSDPNSYSAIESSCLTGFSNLGRPTQKQIEFMRPTILSDGSVPAYQIAARFRWDMAEAGIPVVTGPAAGATWNTALWDQAVWAGAFAPTQSVSGAAGMGPEVAIAMRIRSVSRIRWVGVDLEWTEGGYL